MGVRATLDSASPHAIDTKQIKSDKTLLASIAKGSADALRTLFARHQTAVHRFVLQLTSNPSIAEEVVSDVFLEVWRSARNFEGKSQFSTWLLAIARHKALTARRRLKDAIRTTPNSSSSICVAAHQQSFDCRGSRQ